MKRLIFVASFVSALFIADFANAQGRGINRNQHKRVEQVKHGQLSRHDGKQLKMQQHKVREMKRIAMADGRITARERAAIRNAERKLAMAMRNHKYDTRYRW